MALVKQNSARQQEFGSFHAAGWVLPIVPRHPCSFTLVEEQLGVKDVQFLYYVYWYCICRYIYISYNHLKHMFLQQNCTSNIQCSGESRPKEGKLLRPSNQDCNEAKATVAVIAASTSPLWPLGGASSFDDHLFEGKPEAPKHSLQKTRVSNRLVMTGFIPQNWWILSCLGRFCGKSVWNLVENMPGKAMDLACPKSVVPRLVLPWCWKQILGKVLSK